MEAFKQSFCLFRKEVQLESSLDDWMLGQASADDAALPGFPRMKLKYQRDVDDHLQKEMWCENLERMATHLWLLSTHSSANITPLHAQSFRKREIVLTEDPGLHLVWRHNQMFIKPLPKYLLSFAFWDQYLLADSHRVQLRRVALGIIRSYYYLIQHESDFEIAKDKRLIPQAISWKDFCSFSANFHSIRDDAVSKRYEYGELRLSRLNLWAVVLLRKMSYQDEGLQYGDYFSGYFAPLLFVFGTFSVLLSAIQVGLAAETLDAQGWRAFGEASRWFAIVSIFACVAPAVWLVLVFVIKFLDECVFAIRGHFGHSSRRALALSSA